MQACKDELDLSFIKVGRSPLTVSASSAQRGQWESTLCFSPSSPVSIPCPPHHHLPSSSRDLVDEGTCGRRSELEETGWHNFLHFTEKKTKAQGRGMFRSHSWGFVVGPLIGVCIPCLQMLEQITTTWVD